MLEGRKGITHPEGSEGDIEMELHYAEDNDL